ncbi:MAG TPA: Uma2 family endonuclease [Urbifossiella sp.]|jgi:Uma2 family endonuclease|nr:Uma2 family endonuclease [Urbifossiella sp.]
MHPATAEPDTLADVLHALGDVPAHRVIWRNIGRATEEDMVRLLNGHPKRRVELVDGVLVEKPMGGRESYLAFALTGYLFAYKQTHNIGVFGAPDASMRLRAGLVRLPDIHFTDWANIPGNSAHLRPVVDYPPDLAVEILSDSDRPGMTARKLREYFAAGTRVVWVIDPLARTVDIYSDPADPDAYSTRTATDTLDCQALLPGFALPLGDLFGDPQVNPRQP